MVRQTDKLMFRRGKASLKNMCLDEASVIREWLKFICLDGMRRLNKGKGN